MRVMGLCGLFGLFGLAGCDLLFQLAEIDPPPPDAPPDAPPAFVCPAEYVVTWAAAPASRFRLSDVAASWTSAVGDCADDAAGTTHLAVINSEDERIQLAAQTPNSRWFGLTDRNQEGAFVWVTAEEVAPLPLTGEPWGPGQPDNQAMAQHCVRLQGASDGGPGYYDDSECAASYRYACECDGYADDPNRY